MEHHRENVLQIFIFTCFISISCAHARPVIKLHFQSITNSPLKSTLVAHGQYRQNFLFDKTKIRFPKFGMVFAFFTFYDFF